MPLNGALLLSDRTDPKLRLLCRKCGLRRQYDNQALMDRFGDVGVPNLMTHLAALNGCRRAAKLVGNDFCGLTGKAADDPDWLSSRWAPPRDPQSRSELPKLPPPPSTA